MRFLKHRSILLTYIRFETTLAHTEKFLKYKYGVEDVDVKKLDYGFINEYAFWLKAVRNCNQNSTIKYLSQLIKCFCVVAIQLDYSTLAIGNQIYDQANRRNFITDRAPMRERWLLLLKTSKSIIMKIKFLKLIVLGSVLITACNKGSNNSIDVSKQWKVDYSGNLISGLSDGQWGNKNFTSQELDLFNTLDTVALNGTTMPDSVFEEQPTSHNFSFPNPFTQFSQLYFRFTDGYSGQLVLKYVIVNSGLNILDKGAIKIQATVCSTCPNLFSSSGIIQLTSNISSGQFRLYYTLSSQASNHFYKTWGNIQKN